jgi:hypothetical protein
MYRTAWPHPLTSKTWLSMSGRFTMASWASGQRSSRDARCVAVVPSSTHPEIANIPKQMTAAIRMSAQHPRSRHYSLPSRERDRRHGEDEITVTTDAFWES